MTSNAGNSLFAAAPLPKRRLCFVCYEKITVEFMRDHALSHFSYNPFKCQLCSHEFSSEVAIEMHAQMKHNSITKGIVYSNDELDKFMDYIYTRNGANALMQNSDAPAKPLKQRYVKLLDANKKLFENLEFVSLQYNLGELKSNKSASALPTPSVNFVKPILSENVRSPSFGANLTSNGKMCLKCKKTVRLGSISTHILQHLPDHGLDWLVQCIICKRNPCKSLYRSNLIMKHIVPKHRVTHPQENVHFIDRSKTENSRAIISLTKKKCFSDFHSPQSP